MVMDVNYTYCGAYAAKYTNIKSLCCTFLRVSWTAKRSNLSILKKINPEYSLGGLTLKPKPQYFGHLMPKANSLEKKP